MSQSGNELTLTFRLSRLQRLLNPQLRFLQILVAVATYSGLVLLVGSRILERQRGPGTLMFLTAVLAIVFWVLWRFAFKTPLQSFYYLLATDHYINTVVFREDRIDFGVDGVQWTVPAKNMVLWKGVLGTYCLEAGPGVFVLPKDAIAFEDLKLRLAETNR